MHFYLTDRLLWVTTKGAENWVNIKGVDSFELGSLLKQVSEKNKLFCFKFQNDLFREFLFLELHHQ